MVARGHTRILILIIKRRAWSSCYCGLFSRVFLQVGLIELRLSPWTEMLQRAISYITLHITLEILFSHICELLTDCPNLILILFFQASSFISINGKDFLCRHFTFNALSQTFSSNNTFLQTIFCMTQKGGSLFVAVNNYLT